SVRMRRRVDASASRSMSTQVLSVVTSPPRQGGAVPFVRQNTPRVLNDEGRSRNLLLSPSSQEGENVPVEAFRRLLELERRLRGPGGCPWDAEQTVETLKPNLLEETYEALEAHSSGDPEAFREELGDLLYVLIFMGMVAEEEGLFTFRDMIQGAYDKI